MSMRILGIDYGRKKIGMAVTEGSLAEPYKVIRVNSFQEAVEKVSKEVEVSKVSKVVVGISEGEMGEESKKFAESIGAEIYDETLTSQDAQRMAIEAGIKRSRRQGMEDAYAACLMLQNYLDSIQTVLR